jgi:CheY-like chemotaxis protein
MTERRHVEQLQLADRHKNEFLAMLAHELRNPLAPIRNGVELLKMSSNVEPEVQETTRMMERQVVHLVRLVDDLLDVSRIVTGKVHLDCMPIDVDRFLDRAVEEIQPTIDARGHELMLVRPARRVVVDGDVVRLAQVISNLLGNAAKYTDQPSQIWLSVETKSDWVEIRIRDSGIGMTPGELSRVFNLFEQADNSIGRARGGLGVGLTVVKRIVELHGGTVAAASAGPGKGCELTVRLPLSKSVEAPDRSSRGPERKANSGRRILVVDDNVDAAVSVERLLKSWGHEVHTAFNGPTAINLARLIHPQIVLLDIGMPGMSGYEVAMQLRSEPTLAGILLLALTGYGQADDRRRSQEAGFDHHLTKPPDPAALAALLDTPPQTT